MLELILTALFVLILGSYAYTYRLDRRIASLKENDVKHLQERVTHLEEWSKGDGWDG